MLSRIALFFSLAGFAANALALSLGPIETHSPLYGKFEAEVEVIESIIGEADDMHAALAGAEDFERMGVERLFSLTQLQFELSRTQARTTIKIRSRRPITEPYLDFVVEVIWRGGRMLKEYTVLLDPPGFRPRAAKAAAPQVAPKVAVAPVGAKQPAVRQYGPTMRNDTLWEIAQRTRDSSDTTVQQQMLAIKALNPDAFINDNINLLKQGQTLRIPTAEDVQVRSPVAAIRQVESEKQAWQADRAGPAQSSPEAATGQLQIVAQQGDRVSGLDVEPVSGKADSEQPVPTPASPLSRQVKRLKQVAQARMEQIHQRSAAQARAMVVKDRQVADLKNQMQEMQQEITQMLAVDASLAAAATTQPGENAQPLAVLKQWWWLFALLIVGLVLLIWFVGRGEPPRRTQ